MVEKGEEIKSYLSQANDQIADIINMASSAYEIDRRGISKIKDYNSSKKRVTLLLKPIAA